MARKGEFGEPVVLDVGGFDVRISNPERPYFSARGETKLDPAVEDEQTLTMLFTSRLNGPIEAPTWDHPTVPLVLIWTDYAPYTDLEPPVSKYQPIIWLDPSTEMTLLRSLDQIGLIQMHTNDA